MREFIHNETKGAKDFKAEVTDVNAKRAEFTQEFGEELMEFVKENSIEEIQLTLDDHQTNREKYYRQMAAQG